MFVFCFFVVVVFFVFFLFLFFCLFLQYIGTCNIFFSWVVLCCVPPYWNTYVLKCKAVQLSLRTMHKALSLTSDVL